MIFYKRNWTHLLTQVFFWSISAYSFLILYFASFCKADARNTFKIGVSAPLSGDLAHVGADLRRGLELAVKDFSDADLEFRLILEDNQYRRSNAASAANKLLYVNKVDAIISLWDMSEVVAPIAERVGIPHFAIRWNPHIAEKYSLTMTIESTYISYVNSWIALLRELEVKSVALITEENEGWQLAEALLKKRLPEENIKIIKSVNYNRDQTAHGSIVLSIAKEKPDMILLITDPPHTEIFIKRIRETMGNQRYSGYFEIEHNFELIEGMPYVSQFHVKDAFRQKFEAAYGKKEIMLRSPQAYDIINLIAHVLRSEETSMRGKALVNSISKVKDFAGVSGVLNPNGSRVIESESVWRVVKGGERYPYP